MSNFSEQGRWQIGWRLALDKKGSEPAAQLSTVQRLGALAERAAAARVHFLIGAHVTSQAVDPALLSEGMRAATPPGRSWELVTVSPERLSPNEMIYARGAYDRAFREALHPYTTVRTAARLGLTDGEISSEQGTFYGAPRTYSGTALWEPAPEVFATPEPAGSH